MNHPISTWSKWFLIGFGVRLTLAVVITLLSVVNFETSMMYFADLPTMLVLALAEALLPASVFGMLVGSHPFYVPMNLIAGALWGGIFLLIPLTRKLVFLYKNKRTAAA